MPRDEGAGAAGAARRLFGSGPLPVLALHCALGHSGLWKGLAAALHPCVTLTAPDLPGHGRSEALPPGEDVHDAACAAMRPFRAPGQHLIGHSFGATLALRLALEAEEPPATLTLIEPVLFAAARGHALHEDQRRREAPFAAAMAAGDLPEAARLFNGLWGGVGWEALPEAARHEMAARMPFIAGSEPSLWQDRAGLLASGRLEALDCPVTLIRGAQSPPVMAAVHAGLAARLPQLREVVLPGAGHMLPLTHPRALAACLPPPLAPR